MTCHQDFSQHPNIQFFHPISLLMTLINLIELEANKIARFYGILAIVVVLMCTWNLEIQKYLVLVLEGKNT